MADYTAALNEAFAKGVKGKNKGAVSAVIFDNEKILYSFYDGFIDKEKKLAPKDDSLFMIGSNTKVMTALGIFRLYEDGKLSLDDPITKFIPEFSVKSRIGEYTITIENLLMHRAGIQCDLYEYIVGTKHKYTDIIDGLKETYMTSAPGTMFSYSNLGYTLLGIVLERASGKKYTDFLQEVLFAPLGMEVYFLRENELPSSVSERIARSYDKKGKHTLDTLGTMLPAGSNTYTRIGDLAKIGQLLMNDGRLGEVQLYKPETIQLMKTLKVMDELDNEMSVVGYGLIHHGMSLDYETGRILGHGGDTMYHHSSFDFLPDEKIGVIVFTNFLTGSGLSRKLAKDLFNTYLKEAGFPQKKKTSEKYVSFDPKDYVKTYDSILGPIRFKVDNKGQLTTVLQKITFTLKKNEEGWLVASPKSLIGKLPPLSNSLKGLKFKQATYLGREILLLEQRGTSGAIGDLYREPGVNSAWLKALGTYKLVDKRFKGLFDKAVLKLQDGGVVVAVSEEGSTINYYLDVVNETEATVKGFGRNTNQTAFLRKVGDTYELSIDGITSVRKVK